MALMLSGAMLLRHLGEAEAGDRVEAAVAGVIVEGRSVTDDLTPSREPGSGVSTAEATDAVLRRLAA
jgi:isocitrate dehydrogenase (NAD+)